MNTTRTLMGMHISVEVNDRGVTKKDIQDVFNFFTYVDEKFSTYKDTSEISKINSGELDELDCSPDMKSILELCEETKDLTYGYFDICKNGKLDPSGLVKGWSIWKASEILKNKGFYNYYVDAGGDIQVNGTNRSGQKWTLGIRNPFNEHQIVKVICLNNSGLATSGTALRGQHVYDPYNPGSELNDIISISVIGPNIFEADRFATAAFAMGRKGIGFINSLEGFEGYMIDHNGIATYTQGFNKFTKY